MSEGSEREEREKRRFLERGGGGKKKKGEQRGGGREGRRGRGRERREREGKGRKERKGRREEERGEEGEGDRKREGGTKEETEEKSRERGKREGEWWGRGHRMMVGKCKREGGTADASVEGGWLRTGDMARAEEDGVYRSAGQIKELFIRGGENIYPREVEDFLRMHEKMQDVQVVGVRDEKFGEQVSI